MNCIGKSKFNRTGRKLVLGLNTTLAAVNAPINEAVNVLAKVSDRDLSIRMEGAYIGQFGSIKTSLNNALDCLSETLAQVSLGAEQVNVASCEIGRRS